MASGFLTMIQVFRCKIYKTPYASTGLVSVMGTSFTFLPIACDGLLVHRRGQGRGRPSRLAAKGGPRRPWTAIAVGYGKFLGTAMIASLLELVVGFTWKTKITKMFFPVVVGMAVMMIGCALIASGIKYLGGGVFCAQNTLSKTAWRVEAGVNMNGQNKFINGPPSSLSSARTFATSRASSSSSTARPSTGASRSRSSSLASSSRWWARPSSSRPSSSGR